MRLASGRSIFVKISIIAALAATVAAICLIGQKSKAAASAFGPTPGHTNAPGEGNCTACHTSFDLNSGSGDVQITGLPATYTPGQQINVTVRVNQADAVIYGFQLTAIDSTGQTAGTFTLPESGGNRMQIQPGIIGTFTRSYIEHTSEGLTNGQFGFNSWTFIWTAPLQPAGKIDFFVAGNAANSDGSTSGDNIYTSGASTLPASSSTPASISGKVMTPSGLALRNTKVILTAADNSQQSTVTSSFGIYSFANIPSGQSYTLSVVSKRYRFTSQTMTLSGDLTNVDFVGLE